MTELLRAHPGGTGPEAMGIHSAIRRAGDRYVSQVLGRIVRGLAEVPHLGTWFGLAVTAAGFALLVINWAMVAGLSSVGLQLPWLVSAGFTGLGLVLCGLTVIIVSIKLRCGVEQRGRLSELRQTLVELRAVLEDER